MKSLGICCGASTISAVEMIREGHTARIVNVISRPHDGNPKQVVADLLASVDLENCDRMASTGRKLRHLLNLSTVSEPLAVEQAAAFIQNRYPRPQAIVSAGGETFMAYKLDREGRIQKVFTGNKCASGTGEFFLQQIRRMDVDLHDAVQYARLEQPYPVSGRCSVFCKSDCTHATNKGIPKGQVVAGLCRMMANKVLELLKDIPHQNIMVVGGTTRNDVMMKYLHEEIDGLLIPKEAAFFEAMGAALWALEHETTPFDLAHPFKEEHSQFEYHPRLTEFESNVTFARMVRGKVENGDRCILGLDVGSTTTKAVMMRISDQRILASEYLRTNGDPVGASRRCYRTLRSQLAGIDIVIEGLGVTGSGRKIAGLHALTGGVINEIIAHATAAVHFDPEVDTLFEIGGQDAKYTYITNGVASDYAMNEACSAGTGSFLEESAKETLGIEMEEIAGWAMRGMRPPNFNDQCAAFISSDIKNASHEGLSKEDTVAGLVYSVCMNYINRVKGSRPVGSKVFMQGGVCYNRAVPVAMAALSGKHIIVPPEPGLMGAYGVALEVLDRIEKGIMPKACFRLDTLIDREVEYREPFTCTGGAEACDIGCTINRIAVEGRTYPFGGACNRYYNLRHNLEVNTETHDLVALREKMIFEEYAADSSGLPDDAPTIGINRSFLVNMLYPLFSRFFQGIGYRTVLPDAIDPAGVDARTAPFCYPFEISHGYFLNLLSKEPDHLFLPHIQGIEVENGYRPSKLCPLVQGESFVLKTTFEREIGTIPVHQPFLQPNKGIDTVRAQFMDLGRELGVSAADAEAAFNRAWYAQKEMEEVMRRHGRAALKALESEPDRIGIVLFGRPYNAFAHEANKGIPNKFASRGCTIIPVDFLDLQQVSLTERMYWSMGQIILKGAEIVRSHPQLFGTYITNFSCGPDSFIIGFFRDKLGEKPSLTLELDNHTADAGLETRIEAFLDIVTRYRSVQIVTEEESFTERAESRTADRKFSITTSDGELIGFDDPRVKLIFPSMSQWASRAIASSCRRVGVRAEALPAMTEEDLKRGKGNTLCKECLPLQLTTGALLRHLDMRPDDEVTVYFMPTTEGPCRFGQYREFMNNLIRKRHIRNVVFLSLSTEDSYAGLGSEFEMLCWYATVIADSFHDIHNMMLVNAVDPADATAQLDTLFCQAMTALEQKGLPGLRRSLKRASQTMASIPMKTELRNIPTILLVGEIYVRAEGLARRWLPEYLAKHGIATHMAPLHEWIHYIHHEYAAVHIDAPATRSERLKSKLTWNIMKLAEKDVNNILARSGWHVRRPVDMKSVIEAGSQYISRRLWGEAILTVGGSLSEVGTHFCGSIAIGPFGCMPNRLSEAILSVTSDREHLTRFRTDEKTARVTAGMETMPFLAIESDGSPFPQIIEARLETFILQARRLHGVMTRAAAASKIRPGTTSVDPGLPPLIEFPVPGDTGLPQHIIASLSSAEDDNRSAHETAMDTVN